MTDYIRLAGSTDVSVVIFIFNPTTGVADTSVVFNTSGLDLQYRREGAASVAITEVTLAALTTAHTDGGFLHIGNGYYRLDLPDAAVASGVAGVQIHGALTSRSIVGCYVHLVAYNPQDAVRLGLTALPNVASGSAGAIPTTGTGANQISVTSGAVLLADNGITAAKINADAITAAKIADGAIDAATFATGAITATAIASDAITSAKIADGAITAAKIATGAIDADALAADAVTEIQSGLSTFNHTTNTVNLSTTSEGQIDAIESRVTTALPNSGPGASGGLPLYDDLFSVVAEGTLATVTNAGQMTLSAAFASSDDFYNGMFLVPQDGPAAHQPRAISDYVGSTKTCTFTGTGSQLSRPFSVAPEAGDSVKILGLSGTL